MPLLYYWKRDNYLRDLDEGASFHLNQGSARLHEVAIGESLWAFTRAADGTYVVAAELVVRAKTSNPSGYRYGPYRVWGDLVDSRYFRVDGQASIEPVIRSLSLRPKEGVVLGRSFQGHAAVRQIQAADDVLMRAACRGLPLEPRARLMPEAPLELSLQGVGVPPMLLADGELGISPSRRRQLMRDVPRRSRALIRQLHERYHGRCQICQWEPASVYGSDVTEGHHLQWLSRGGVDELGNLILLCPNHHRAVHACDAHIDYAGLYMDFGRGLREPLRLPGHLAEVQGV